MAQVHGKLAQVKVATADISAYCNKAEFKQKGDSHDTTTFGALGHTYLGGLTDGTFSVEGIYDNTAVTGPRPAVQAKLTNSVAVVYGPEGGTSGKPLLTFQAVITSYEESAPVDDIVSWSGEFQISGSVTASTAP